jgi:hypothetical protein
MKMQMMHDRFTQDSFHTTLVRDVFPKRLNSADSMLLFALLHTHQVNLVGAVVSDAPSIRSFAAITQRHCAECLAYLWRGTNDDRASYTHWYWAWNTDWSYERIDSLSGAELQRFIEIKRIVESHPAIESLTPEDD